MNLSDTFNTAIYTITTDDISECGYNLYNNQSSSLIRNTIRDARQSLPSYTLTMTSFSAIFIVTYLSQSRLRQTHAWSRSLRCIFGLVSIWLVGLMANTKLTLNRNHIEDIVISVIIGTFNASFVVICYLNGFNENSNLSNTDQIDYQSNQDNGSDSMNKDIESTTDDVIRYLQIPRVILRNSMRMSRRWSRSSRLSPGAANGRLPPVPELRTAGNGGHQELQMNYIREQRFL